MAFTPPYRDFVSSDPELAAVDVSVRWPVLVSFIFAVHWMVTGTFLLVYSSSLRHPEDGVYLLDSLTTLSQHLSAMTYGRVWPAATDALVYGWLGSASLGLVAWLLGRMGRAPVRGAGILMTAVVFWNLGVAAGLTGIFLGQSSSVELLEFPGYANGILWCAYILFAYTAIFNYLERTSDRDHVGQAWLLVALFAFPWLFGAGSVLLGHHLPGSNVMQGALSAWYVHGLYTLWIAPIGLGALYYLIPKVSGLTLHYPTHVRLAFWSWLFLAPWTAVHDMVGGPYPEATVSVGLILSGLIFIPVVFIGLGLFTTAVEGDQKHHGSVVLPFLTMATVFFLASGVVEQLLSVRSLNQALRFTMFREANFFLWLYGFLSFVIFGAYYYLLPRLLNFGWRSTFLIRFHYYACVYGILLFIVILCFGGVMEGMTLENPDKQVTMATVSGVFLPFDIAATVCISVISIGNGVFAFHLGWMLLAWARGGSRIQDPGEVTPEKLTPLEMVISPREEVHR